MEQLQSTVNRGGVEYGLKADQPLYVHVVKLTKG